MTRFVVGEHHNQKFPEWLDHCVGEDIPVSVIDVFFLNRV
jgi:hypothetical protein